MGPWDAGGSRRPCLVVFTKPAVPGRVKTRLVGPLSEGQAAELHAAFLGDLSARLAAATWTLWTAWDLDEGEAPATELVPVPVARAVRQQGADLGERLFRVLRLAADEGFDPVAAVGSDHPTFPLTRLDECSRAFAAGADVVIGPAADGGYYLLACRRRSLDPGLFTGIDWSTDRVLEQTLERCAGARLRVELLATGRDVDTPDDLRRLAAELAARPGQCPRTEGLLAQWGMA
ncbi:MAG TPA: TIGR04282 family arsenosugar biosynthesis glycosyltransferase [Thermoanaerobaculia bacterium]|nr:TIGR04282 family arsenosugar biosynthesis glycosyltransferase [Thermoanaerobaculia bacterium]